MSGDGRIERACSKWDRRQRLRLATKDNAEAAIVTFVRIVELKIFKMSKIKWIAAKTPKNVNLLSYRKPPGDTFGRCWYKVMTRYGRLIRRSAEGIKDKIESSKRGVKSNPVGFVGPNALRSL